jgi:beta-1,4-mannosyl-glycoprotein beta-1,4-N-acetylglucosaminyltransferase
MKIIDCFIFYNELELLTYRLNLLNNVVDYFVIVESTHTFIGKEKNCLFNDNKHLFKDFSNKIIHIIVNDFPFKYPDSNIDPWENERFQRNSIRTGLNYIKDLSHSDMIIISDVDEIPDPNTLEKIKKGDIVVDIGILEMDFYYYNLNTRFRHKWFHCKILSYDTYIHLNMTCHNIRHLFAQIISNGGWHLSYFGDKFFIQNKIKNFSHQEYNIDNFTDLDKIENRVKNSIELFDNDTIIDKIKIEDNKYLPIDYDKYLNKYRNY